MPSMRSCGFPQCRLPLIISGVLTSRRERAQICSATAMPSSLCKERLGTVANFLEGDGNATGRLGTE
jgi:hypothetical protein